MGNDDIGHVALPKLYGAPAYARPVVVPVHRAERPFDPDDLPLEAELESEEPELVGDVAPEPDPGGAGSDPAPMSRERPPTLRGRPFRLGRSRDGHDGGDPAGG